MDKYEYKIRAEEIKTLISQKKYAEAAKVADTIDWTRVKSVMMLCTVSDVYKVNRRFEDAKLLLEMANERHPSGRMIIYSLCDLSIRMGDVVHAIEYYKDFVQIAPNDSGRYVLQYKLYEAQDVGLEERIAVLEELKKKDYREKWAYELAYLYHRVGLATKCVEECDELILWFGEGKYVIKAMELKSLHQPLSPSQQKKFDAYMMRRQGLRVPEELEEKNPDKTVQKKAGTGSQDMDIQVKTMDVGKYNTINLQKELAASMKELMQEGQPEQQGIHAKQQGISAEQPGVSAEQEGIPAKQQEARAAAETEYVPVKESAGVSQNVRHSQTDYDNYLSQEYDGQISMVVPEEHPAEKQITGQMNIDDIMREWETMKRENEEKRRQELRQRMEEKTGKLLQDFDEVSHKGVLERLQKEERIPVDRRERHNNGVISAHTKIWAAEEVQNALKAASAADSTAKEQQAEKEPSPNEKESSAEAVKQVEEPAREEIPVASAVPVHEEPLAAAAAPVCDETPASAAPAREEIPVASAVPVHEEPPAAAVPVRDEIPAAAAPKQEENTGNAAVKEAVEAQGKENEQVPKSRKDKAQKAERPAPEGRGMSSAQKRLFASFVPTKGAMKRLVAALDQLSLAAYTGNLIITGEPGADTLDLAKNIVKDLKSKEPDFSGRIAKITGNAMNSSKKPPAELVEKLAGGALMIEKAGEMKRECALKLLAALNQERWGILIILMDTKRRIKRLLEENPEMESFFNARFDVEALDNSTLVAYGCQYAKMQEYAIDELGRLALHTRIEDMQTSDHVVTVKDVREIVDEAIDHAERKTPKHFVDVLLSRRYDDNDMIILHEGDFI
ncbi:MAG TPA: hypothetical protein H9717_16105 [Candidatus Eisenbergiella merdipullorum]|uniref:Tetratricopeptide repeat protein n=1 Tax=Candidatus Eisenbergiella merdipullorum TaxID=2838553 RepID=A0A9D2IAK5_9FIRM|nr:hypothetical protein [Candidatus Eisenbergiella merdipullorum]